MAKNDGNVQDISVHDKENSALGATQEAQDMSRLDSIVVPPPAYTDPSNPVAASGSINMSVNTHPSDISEDYGAGVEPGEHDSRSPIDTHATEAQQIHTDHPGRDESLPENRDEWFKKHWQSQAHEYGLGTRGNTEELKDRVEEYEASLEDAKGWQAHEWIDEIEGVENQQQLDDLKALYGRSGAEYPSVDSAFEARATELNNES